MKKDYEGLLILDPTLSEETVAEEVVNIMAFFADEAKVESLGRKRFAYPIKKQTQGYYLLCRFCAEPAKKAEWEESLRLNPAVLRSLVIRAPRLGEKEKEN